jgi:aspartate kinase
MSEMIVAKGGGTSHANAGAVRLTQTAAEQATILVVSAPGKLGDNDKVTNNLVALHGHYQETGEVCNDLPAHITERYAHIGRDLVKSSVISPWIDKIPSRIEDAVRNGRDAASMLGEILMAEIYGMLGYTMLDPGRAPDNLGNDREAWRGWLSKAITNEKRYVLPGNITRVNGHLVTFSRGGSDTSGGHAADGIRADLNLNLTDDSAFSADPKLITPRERLRRIDHLLYVEGRELGRNGTGLLHPAAMVPLMLGNIPTEIRSTFNPGAPATLLDNDQKRAEQRSGRIMALSLMDDVSILRVHEPGMAEEFGRLAAFDTALASEKIPVIDSNGDGVDSQNYIVDSHDLDQARRLLRGATKNGTVEASEARSLITLVGHRLDSRIMDHIFNLAFNAGIDVKRWQTEGHEFSVRRHSIRFSVEPEKARQVLDAIHDSHIELNAFVPRQ